MKIPHLGNVVLIPPVASHSAIASQSTPAQGWLRRNGLKRKIRCFNEPISIVSHGILGYIL